MVEEQEKSDSASPLNRALAKFIDVLIFGALTQILSPFGALAGLMYILICDGLSNGRSPGKNIIGLRTVLLEKGNSPCTYRESIFRNSPIGLVAVFYLIPFLGWVLFFTLGLAIIFFELFVLYQDPQGLRLGDNLAHTWVVSDK